MGYSLHPIFRQTPQDGAVVSTDTWTVFTDLGGPKAVTFDDPPDMKTWDDVNYDQHVTVRGFRRRITLSFQIMTMADSNYLYDIVNRLGKSTWETELSIDGGTTYYPVVLDRFRGPMPLAGKPFVGAGYELVVEVVSLLDELPYLASA